MTVGSALLTFSALAVVVPNATRQSRMQLKASQKRRGIGCSRAGQSVHASGVKVMAKRMVLIDLSSGLVLEPILARARCVKGLAGGQEP